MNATQPPASSRASASWWSSAILPDNAYAGTSTEEEDGLIDAYKKGLAKEWGIKKFNLDDLYVRFFRIAEHCIAEVNVDGQGVLCYISNYSYLSEPSYVVMRQRLLKEFDEIWMDNLNGDSRDTGKIIPAGLPNAGAPDPSIFSTPANREGIRKGTAIGLMVRKSQRDAAPVVRYRDFWGAQKREELLASLDVEDYDGQFGSTQSQIRQTALCSNPSDQRRICDVAEAGRNLRALPPENGLIERRGGAPD